MEEAEEEKEEKEEEEEEEESNCAEGRIPWGQTPGTGPWPWHQPSAVLKGYGQLGSVCWCLESPALTLWGASGKSISIVGTHFPFLTAA